MMNHNDFPEMTDQFDQRVRQTLDSLPEQPQRVRRFPFKRAVSIGLVAALCVGGTAFAAGVSGGFPLFFPGGTDAPITEYVTTPAPGTVVDENDKYRMTVESVLFDESAGAGLVSLHLENKSGDGVMPFEAAETLAEYQQPDIVWSNLSECVNVKDGQYIFNVVYDGFFGYCGGHFYLDKSRSTENDYYIEGAFIPAGDYTPGSPLRLEVTEQGNWDDVDGMQYYPPVLCVELPDFEPMPYYQTANGAVTLSQIGLRITAQQPDEVLVDQIEYIAVKMKDGTEQVVWDDASETYQTLYTMGFGPDAGFDSDTAVYALAQTFDLADVQSVVINDTEYPLSA